MRRAMNVGWLLLWGLLVTTTAVPALSATAPTYSPAVLARAPTHLEPDSLDLNDLDAFITAVMTEWKVPGLAIAVIKDGQVVLSKGYGYRDVDQKLPVTPRTLFAIGSITKSFTVTALSILADEGKLDWDEPVLTYLSDFRLKDEVATLHMTARDLVTHRSGLPRHDGLWYGGEFGRRQLYDRLRHLEPSRDFRAVFQYQNLMFMTAGLLAGQLSGVSWESLVRARILDPLGMSRSNFSVSESPRSDDFAYPYTRVEEDVRQIGFRNIDEIGPAGSINSSVEEMIRYVQLHMDKGMYNGTRILSEANAEQMQTPQMVIPGAVTYEELGHSSYGLGLIVTTYRGRKLVHHGGGIDGFISLLAFMPSEKLGMIVLTNLSGNNPVPTIVTRGVFDRTLGLEPVDWLGRIKDQQAKADEAEKAGEKQDVKVEGTAPSHALSDYVGQYEHAGYGLLSVELDGEAHLRAEYQDNASRLEHYHYDVFQVAEDPLNPFSGGKLLFLYNLKGEIDRVAVPLEPAVEEIVFTRVAEAVMRDRAFLEAFVGEYELAGTVITVALKGTDAITLHVPGQPTYDLVPTRGTSFDLASLSGYSVEFKRDDSGAVTEVVIYQPNGTFVASRR